MYIKFMKEFVTKPFQRTKTHKIVTSEERVFLDNILAGKTYAQALCAAGYITPEQAADSSLRTKWTAKGKGITRKVQCYAYLKQNEGKIFLTEDMDIAVLKRHIYEIALGQAEAEVTTKDGEVVKVKPTFAEQIAASSCFMKIVDQDKKYMLAGVKTVSSNQNKVQINKVQSILDKYKMTKQIGIDEAISVGIKETDKGKELIPISRAVEGESIDAEFEESGVTEHGNM